MIKFFIGYFACIIFTACSVNKKIIDGTYVNDRTTDTLKIFKDNKYELQERLKSNKPGWTYGTWHREKNRIYFKNNIVSKVGYAYKIIKDSTKDDGQISLFLEEKNKPVKIKNVQKIIAKDSSFIDPNLISNNSVKIKSINFDKIIINTQNYAPLIFTNQSEKYFDYKMILSPNERIYYLDKFPFKIKTKKIKSVKNKEYKGVVQKFRKIKK